MAVTVKLKNHQNYVVNKKRERNVSYTGGVIQYNCAYSKEPKGMCAG